MSLSGKAVKRVKSSSISKDSVIASEADDRHSDGFPPYHQLVVTTTQGVYAWETDVVTELFHSGSRGIVAAKRLASTSNMLAVADNQVVILHDVKKGKQKSYRLRGSEVHKL